MAATEPLNPGVVHTRAELDPQTVCMTCPQPHPIPGALHIVAACHPGAGLIAYYLRGILTLACALCRNVSMQVGVVADQSGVPDVH